jgi:hypothetical protein
MNNNIFSKPQPAGWSTVEVAISRAKEARIGSISGDVTWTPYLGSGSSWDSSSESQWTGAESNREGGTIGPDGIVKSGS